MGADFGWSFVPSQLDAYYSIFINKISVQIWLGKYKSSTNQTQFKINRLQIKLDQGKNRYIFNHNIDSLAFVSEFFGGSRFQGLGGLSSEKIIAYSRLRRWRHREKLLNTFSKFLKKIVNKRYHQNWV